MLHLLINLLVCLEIIVIQFAPIVSSYDTSLYARGFGKPARLGTPTTSVERFVIERGNGESVVNSVPSFDRCYQGVTAIFSDPPIFEIR